MNSAIISSISQTLYIIHITISLINTLTVSTKVKSVYFEFGGFVVENQNKCWVQLFGAECWSYFWAVFYWNSVVRAFNSCCMISLPLANVWCQEYFVTSKIMSHLVHLSVLIYLLLTVLIICIRMTFVKVVWWGEPETIIILTPLWHWIKITCYGPGSVTQCLIYILCFSCITHSVYLPPLCPCSACSLSCLSWMLILSPCLFICFPVVSLTSSISCIQSVRLSVCPMFLFLLW